MSDAARDDAAASAPDPEEARRLEKLYDRLAERFTEVYSEGKDRSADMADQALKTAADQLEKTGEFTQEQSKRLQEWLRRDMQDFADDLRRMRDEARDRVRPDRLKAGALAGLSKVLHSTGDVLNKLADRADSARAYATGEVTSAGSLTCDGCDTSMRFKTTTRIPPCPKCHGTHFKKTY